MTNARTETQGKVPKQPVVGLDHLLIAVNDLATGSKDYAILIGAEPVWTGIFDQCPATLFVTSNVALCLIETPGTPGLRRVVFRVADQQRFLRRCKKLGIVISDDAGLDPLSVLSPGAARSLAIADSSSTRGLELGFVGRNDESKANTSKTNLSSDTNYDLNSRHQVNRYITGLDHLVVNSANAEGTAYLLAAQLGLDMRLDMRQPKWAARMMFFRCGDLILEVVHSLADSSQSTAPQTASAGQQSAHERSDDSFYGLSWRVHNADAAQRALADAGFDVSGTREGRKPGTRVFTVRDRTASIATLLLEAPRTPAQSRSDA